MSDLISRQETIDALKKQAEEMFHWSERYKEQRKGILTAINVVSDVPSAEPEAAKRIVGKRKDGDPLWYECERCTSPVDRWDTFCCMCGRRLVDEV